MIYNPKTAVELTAEEIPVSPETSDLLGLQVGASVDEALQIQHQSSDTPVGYIQDSVLTDMGDDWLLCNGDYIYTSEYEELHAKLNTENINIFLGESSTVRTGLISNTWMYYSTVNDMNIICICANSSTYKFLVKPVDGDTWQYIDSDLHINTASITQSGEWIFYVDNNYILVSPDINFRGSTSEKSVDLFYTSSDLAHWQLTTVSVTTNSAQYGNRCSGVYKAGSYYYMIIYRDDDHTSRIVYSSSLIGPYTYLQQISMDMESQNVLAVGTVISDVLYISSYYADKSYLYRVSGTNIQTVIEYYEDKSSGYVAVQPVIVWNGMYVFRDHMLVLHTSVDGVTFTRTSYSISANASSLGRYKRMLNVTKYNNAECLLSVYPGNNTARRAILYFPDYSRFEASVPDSSTNYMNKGYAAYFVYSDHIEFLYTTSADDGTLILNSFSTLANEVFQLPTYSASDEFYTYIKAK